MFIVEVFAACTHYRTCSLQVWMWGLNANFSICGQSQSEKSYLVRSMLCHLKELFDPVPSKIIYCYGEYEVAFDDMRRTISNIDFVEGFPDNLHDVLVNDKNSLIIMDDLMFECSKDQRMSELLTKWSYHRGMSVMYLTQNLFPPGPSCSKGN